MANQWWPLSALRLTTSRVELRFATYDDLLVLAQLAFEGIHDEAEMPFGAPWTDAPPQERARATMQWHWRSWAALSPDDWHLPFVVVADDVVVGTQELMAKQFRVRREVSTGSWLGRAHQRQGIGTQMRAAVLEFAFTHLGAMWATTSAFEDNHASNGVSRRLGYLPDGIDVHERRGQPTTLRRYRLSLGDWQQRERPALQVQGLDACRALLGAD
jgi:RimJ/RimL family protein N-acetyltransferase